MWNPVHLNDLTKDEKRKAMESRIFLSENRDGTIKGRMCANRRTHINCIPKEKHSIPTVTTKHVIITSVIDTKQKNTSFFQTKVPQGDERIIVNIRGALVDMLLEIDPENTQRISDW